MRYFWESPLIKHFWESPLYLALVVILPLSAAVVLWRAELLPPESAAVVEDVADRGMNEVAFDELTLNYYEEVMDVDRGQWLRGGAVRLANRVLRKGERRGDDGNWIRLQETGATRDGEGFLGYELVPDYEVTHMGVQVVTNRWGMRDYDVEMAKPTGTFRIALVGGSNTMGYGVELDDTFGKLVEKKLNESLAGGAYDRYEVLNFAVGGYQLLDRLYVVEQKIPPFDPDLIIVSVTMHDLRWAVHQRLAGRLAQGWDAHFDFLDDIVERVGVKPTDSEAKIRQRLKPYRTSLISGAFEELARQSERTGVPIVALMLRLRVNEVHPTMHQQADLAEAAGLITLRIFDAYENQTADEMYLRPTDQHPTTKGHRLIADELYQKMLAEPELSKLLRGE